MNTKIKTLVQHYQNRITTNGLSENQSIGFSENNFAINGFGRIGRTITRNWWKYYRNKLKLVQINTSGSLNIQAIAHLLKYDTMQGKLDASVDWLERQSDDHPDTIGFLLLEKYTIKITAQKAPKTIEWDQKVKVVVEATGKFNNIYDASQHLRPWIKKIIISAPAKDKDTPTSILNVLPAQNAKIFSNSSCTTNCIAPIVHIVNDLAGVNSVSFNTTHAYTDDQNLQDNSHKDLRRARNASLNIIPTSTGASKELEKIFPQLTGNIMGSALRVPVATGSIADITLTLKNKVNQSELNQYFTAISKMPKWKNILAVTSEPLVSSDIIGRTESAIIDLQLTQSLNLKTVKIMAWYDNEAGYCARILDQVVLMH